MACWVEVLRGEGSASSLLVLWGASSEEGSSAQSSADPQTALEEGSLGWAGRAAALEAARAVPVVGGAPLAKHATSQT